MLILEVLCTFGEVFISVKKYDFSSNTSWNIVTTAFILTNSIYFIKRSKFCINLFKELVVKVGRSHYEKYFGPVLCNA